MTPPYTQPTPRDLRSFGWIMAAILIGIFGAGHPLMKGESLRPLPTIIGLLFLFIGTLFPNLLRGIHRIWMQLGLVLGWINSRIILGIFYYLIFVPTAAILRLRGWDPLHRYIDKKRISYRIPLNYNFQELSANMERPY